MRLMLMLLLISATIGCGGSSESIAKPENPIPTLDLDKNAQLKAGDYAPGP